MKNKKTPTTTLEVTGKDIRAMIFQRDADIVMHRSLIGFADKKGRKRLEKAIAHATSRRAKLVDEYNKLYPPKD